MSECKSNFNEKLAESFSSGTKERAATKLVSKNAYKVIKWLFCILFVPTAILILIPSAKDDFARKEPAEAAAKSSQAVDQYERLATWGGSTDNVTAGVWSDEVEVPIGCRPLFKGGNGLFFITKYRNETSEENIHSPGSYVPMSHFSFQLTEKGVARGFVKYVIDCPSRRTLQ